MLFSADLESSMPTRRILLVEDEPAIRAIMADTLGDAGFEVTAICTGDEAAILIADSDRFDVLLTDITMPGLIDGIGLAEHAREVHPDLPVVFVSGRPENARRAEAVGQPSAFVPKPYDVARVITMIDRLMSDEQASS
jgi:CheY-like chemotaxis protein